MTNAGNEVETLFRRSVECHNQGRLSEALGLYDAVLRLNPNVPDVHSIRGVALHSLNRFEEAIESCDRAIKLKPDYAAAYYNRGNSLLSLKRLIEALDSFDRSIKLKPSHAEAYNNKAIALLILNRSDEALENCDRAVALKPNYPEAYNNRAIALLSLRQSDEAVESCNRAIEFRPDFAEAYFTRGDAFAGLKRLGDALQSYDRAIELRPDYAAAYSNRGIALRYMKRLDEAIQSYDRAIALQPGFAEAYLNKSFCLVLMGRLQEGWRLHEWRKKCSEPSGSRTYPQPAWLGEVALEGKTLLIHAEQGLGDTIQFCRYAKLAEMKGAKVIFEAQASLKCLLEGLSPTIEIIALNTTPPNFDYHVALLSLPLAFNTTLESIPPEVPYLVAEKVRIKRWRERIGTHGFKIGICWQGSNLGTEIGRSFPLVQFCDIGSIPDIRLISLQKGDGTEQLENLPAGMRVETLGDDFDAGSDGFVDAAAVMENLDLIITSDTAIAHLAGALGCRTWVALKYVPDWRWMLERSDSPWYPTMRLFRQASPDDWPSLFGKMRAELVNLIGSKSS